MGAGTNQAGPELKKTEDRRRKIKDPGPRSPILGQGIRLLDLSHPEDLYAELARVGVDQAAWEIFEKKRQTLVIKFEDLSVATANILKQAALKIGADCAVDRRVISGRVKKSKALLFANTRQIEEICQRLSAQPECAAQVGVELQNFLKSTFTQPTTLKIGQKVFDFSKRTYVMGILNVTPDSFYDGGRFFTPEQAVAQGLKIAEEGADIIDIGAESTRPGARPVPPEEQLRRLLPVLRPLAKKVKVPISIDTTSAAVAKEALDAGAAMVNDISGLTFDPGMAKTMARAGVPVVVMHIKGRPRTMQKNPVYSDLMGEIIHGLRRSLAIGRRAGIEPGRMLVDPGIGFGKTFEHNLEILRRLKELRSLGAPVVVGPSRKSFIGMVLGLPPAERLEGTLAACVIAAENGANILRVHDVLALKRALAIRDAINGKVNVEAKNQPQFACQTKR